MLALVTASLWLRQWMAYLASKQAWVKIPFSGRSLYGDKLNAAISKATGGKSGFLPQDHEQQEAWAYLFSAGPRQGRKVI